MKKRAPANWRGTSYPLRGFILLVAVGLFWGVNWPLMKIGMSVIPVFTFRTITVVGGGLCLVQMADMAVAAESAWISYPEAKIGFTGGIIASLVSRMPHKAAMELLMTGEKMSAQRAYELGFFNKVVPDADLMSETRSLAQKVAANAPLVIAALKQLADEVMPRGPMEGAGWARRMVEATFASNDLQEGLASFRERRTPTFKGD